MGLLAANLALIDEEGFPAYLESSNRGNDHRYERLGFVQVGEFSAPGGRPTVACMWRRSPLIRATGLRCCLGLMRQRRKRLRVRSRETAGFRGMKLPVGGSVRCRP